MERQQDTRGTSLKIKTIHKDKDGKVIQIQGMKVPQEHQVYKVLETIKERK